MNTPCCEPGCTAEVLCPVHQALADLRAKVLALAEEMDSADPWWREHAQTFDAVLALLPEEDPSNHQIAELDDFEETRWWRVMRDGKLWAETSSEHDARSRMEPGDALRRLYQRTEYEWREET